MAYSFRNSKGKLFYLHGEGRSYWFSPSLNQARSIKKLPSGAEIREAPSGMPYLKFTG